MILCTDSLPLVVFVVLRNPSTIAKIKTKFPQEFSLTAMTFLISSWNTVLSNVYYQVLDRGQILIAMKPQPHDEVEMKGMKLASLQV